MGCEGRQSGGRGGVENYWFVRGRGGRSERDKVDAEMPELFVSDFIFDIMKRFRNAGVPLSREDAKMKAYEAVKKKYNERMR